MNKSCAPVSAASWARAALVAAAALLAACGHDDAVEMQACPASDPVPAGAPGNDADSRLTITNDQATLDARMTCMTQDLAVGDATMAKAVAAITLSLVAEVAPPTVNGQVLQATSVSAAGTGQRMVSYNMQGTPHLGAIDFYDDLQKNNPKLRSQITFNDSDISAVANDGTYVYAAEATDAAGFAYPAVLERIQFSNAKFLLAGNLRVGMDSFAGTGVTATDTEVYATAGSAGSVFAFEKAALGAVGQFALSDARWVANDAAGGRIVVVQGGQPNGQLSVFTAGAFPGGSMTLQNTWPFTGANVPESKSSAVVAGGKAFIAAGPAGVQIVCLDTGAIVGSVPRPDPATVGLPSDVVVTNAVTVDNKLMFIADGEAGVYVARQDTAFKDTTCAQQQASTITVLGKIRFSNLQSANHVEFAEGYLFVAAGLGGTKIVKVTDPN